MRHITSAQTAVSPTAAWLDQLPSGVVVISGGVLHYANPAAAHLLEADQPAGIIGRRVADFLHPLDQLRVEARLKRAEEAPFTNPPTEIRVLTCLGHVRTIAVTSTHYDYDGMLGVLVSFIDMTERAEMEAKLRETEENFQRIMENMQDVFYQTDAHGYLRYVCPAVMKVVGYTAEELTGRMSTDFYAHPEDRVVLVRAVQEHGYVRDFPLQFLHRDGNVIDISLSSRALYDERGQFMGTEGICRDITERRHMERELQRLATRDELTGIENRRQILERLEHLLQSPRGAGAPPATLLLDLDLFKRVNDRYGHAGGDRALRQFVKIVNAERREEDYFGRLGGEEFLLILCGLSTEEIWGIGERIRLAVSRHPFDIGETEPVFLTVSGGIATATPRDRRPNQLLERADHALYRAKAQGRNQILRGDDPVLVTASPTGARATAGPMERGSPLNRKQPASERPT